MAWNLPAAISAATDRTAAWFNAIADCLRALDQHAHSGAAGDGAALNQVFGVQNNGPNDQGSITTYSTIATITITPRGAAVLLLFSVEHQNSSGAVGAAFKIRQGAAQLALMSDYVETANKPQNTALAWLVKGLTPGVAVTFDVQLQASSGTASVNDAELVAVDLTGYIAPGSVGAGTWTIATALGMTPAPAADLNAIRTNLVRLDQHAHSGTPGDGAALELRPMATDQAFDGGVQSITAGSGVIDMTNVSISLVTGGGPVLIAFMLEVDSANAGTTAQVVVNVDGAAWRTFDQVTVTGSISISYIVCGIALHTSLAAGAHTIKLQGTRAANTWNTDERSVLAVELKT